MIKIVEKLFLKKRFVLSIEDPSRIRCIHVPGYSIFAVKSIRELKELVTDSNAFLEHNTKFINRLPADSWELFIIMHDETKDIACHYFAISGNGKLHKHDNFHVEPDAVLLCNAFTYYQYRKKGLYKSLIGYAHKHLTQNDSKKIFTIVERANIRSLKANQAVGLRIFFTNYLIKVLSINIISVYSGMNSSRIILLGKIFGNITLLKRMS
jgi:hypothetical protein